MKKYKNWVAYQLEVDNDNPARLKKVPYSPITGYGAKANDSATWATYQQAVNFATEKARLQGLQLGQNHGVGFEFSDSPFAGIDLDHCIDDKGNLADWAADIVQIMDSYTEYSPSGHGLHILFKGEKIPELENKDGVKVGNIELYYGGRYFTVSEKPYGEPKAVIDASERAEKVYLRYLIKNHSENSTTTNRERPFWKFQPNPDLLEVMFNSKNGEEIRRLYYGDFSGYKSQSEADLALCHYLAFYTGKDATEMNRLFIASGLMRDKWNEKHGDKTYGMMTIEKAIASTRDIYTSSRQQTQGAERQEQKKEQTQGEDNRNLDHTLAEYLRKSLLCDCQAFRSYAERKTGFYNMDQNGVRIYPGLWSIGAVPSLGKTTFCTQMADNLAASGEFVLFFSFEMSEFELATKGLSRLMYKNANDFRRNDWKADEVLTAIEIRRGKSESFSDNQVAGLIERARAEYMQIAENEMIISCIFEMGVDVILQSIDKYADKKPVVFVDYLQVISKVDKKQITRDAIDDTVKALKKAANGYNVPICLISSFNRENYLTTVDFTSFKESGGIEYNCDFLAGLQLRAMNASIFNSDKDTQVKREFVRHAKRANPRELELVVLKNRWGQPGDKYYFDYYAAYDYFQSNGKKKDEIQNEVDNVAETFKAEYERKKKTKRDK